MSSTHRSQRPSPAEPPGDDDAPSRGSSAQIFTGPVALPDEATVITNRPPPGAGASKGSSNLGLRTPLELGKQLAGQRLGHFELIEFAGGGGMGAVFRARDTMLDRIVALKVLSRDQAADDENRRRFRNEAQSAARLDHENIARVYYVGEDRGLNYIVFEFIEGVNVRELVSQRGPLPIEEAISYTLQVADALEHAASRNVVHRDIKPSNILITAQGKAKLVDMGLARFNQLQASTDDLTASGVTLGTFDYISPEQARDPRVADVRSDIYSLGCTLYFMLTGRPPFPEGTVLQKLLQHSSDDPADPRQFVPDLPQMLIDILHHMLAKDPRRRYQTSGELIADLLALSEQVGLRTPLGVRAAHVAPLPSEMSSLERHLPWLAPIALLLLVVAGLDLFWSAGDSPSLPPLPPAGTRGEAVANPPRVPLTGEQPPVMAGDAAAHVARIEVAETQPSAAAGTESGTASSTVEELPGDDGDDTAAQQSDRIEKPALAALPVNSALPSQAPPAAELPADALNQGASTAAASAAASVTETISPSLSTARLNKPLGTDANGNSTSEAEMSVVGDDAQAAPLTQPLRSGVLVVGDGQGPQYYQSLRAACSAAKNGDVIELRYNGRRDEKPITLSNLRVTIRAGDGFQPVLVFHPRQADLIAAPRSMFSLSGGRVRFSGVEVEFEVPAPQAVPAESWSLIEALSAETVELDRCVLTIRNATGQGSSFHDNVAFFRVVEPAGGDSAMMTDGMPINDPVTIRMEHCIARGEATLLRINELESVDFSWNNGLLVISESLLVAAGGQDRPVGQWTLDLRHLTAVLGGPAFQLVGSFENPMLLDTQISAVDCILRTSSRGPLMEQVGIDSAAQFQQRLYWSAERNFYEGFDWDRFWRLVDLASPEPPVELTFADWQMYWQEQQEVLPSWESVVWRQLPAAEQPPHRAAPSDYALDSQAEINPARQAASDGASDAGMKADLLPAVAVESFLSDDDS